MVGVMTDSLHPTIDRDLLTREEGLYLEWVDVERHLRNSKELHDRGSAAQLPALDRRERGTRDT